MAPSPPTRPEGSRRWRDRGERGDALSVAILFIGMFLTILIGVHVLVVGMARTALQFAADSAVAAAQVATTGEREAEGVLGARLAIAANDSSVAETQAPEIIVEEERGVVTALVFGGTISPLLGGVELTAVACGPLDNVPAADLADPNATVWEC